MKLKMAITLIAVSFIIIAMSTPATAYHNRILFMAIGEDLDLPETTNCIIGTIKSGRYSERTTAQVVFYSKIYDPSSEKEYVMTGMFKGDLLTKEHYFYCPVFNNWWVNVWFFMGKGIVITTDTDIEVFFRNSLPLTMPNTGGKFESAEFLMFLSPTGAYCEKNVSKYFPGTADNPIKFDKGWALVGVLWDIGIPMDFGFGEGILPIGPISYLTISLGM